MNRSAQQQIATLKASNRSETQRRMGAEAALAAITAERDRLCGEREAERDQAAEDRKRIEAEARPWVRPRSSPT